MHGPGGSCAGGEMGSDAEWTLSDRNCKELGLGCDTKTRTQGDNQEWVVAVLTEKENKGVGGARQGRIREC